MRVCYLVLSHIGGAQLSRLVTTIQAGDPTADIVLRHDESRSPLGLGRLVASPRVHVLPPRPPVTWGTFSLIEATLESLQHCRREIACDWVVLLSGQHYPIRPLDELARLLSETTVHGYLEVPPPDPPEDAPSDFRWDRWADGYSYRYATVPRAVTRLTSGRIGSRIPRRLWWDLSEWQRWISVRERPRDFSTLIGWRSLRPPFPGRAVKGSQWFALNSVVVSWMLDWLAENPRYANYFRRTYIPDEAFFHTLLYKYSPWELSPTSLHYEQWGLTDSPSPVTLRTEDVPAAIASGAYFARKFDITVDGGALDLVDEVLTGQPN